MLRVFYRVLIGFAETLNPKPLNVGFANHALRARTNPIRKGKLLKPMAENGSASGPG